MAGFAAAFLAMLSAPRTWRWPQGEVRRADHGPVVPVPDTDGTPEIQGVPFPGAEPLNPA
ncbi:hypothetical protein [Streptomyces microflavus]